MTTNEAHAMERQRIDLAERAARWQQVVDRSPLAIAITTGEAHLLRYMNPAFMHLMHAERTPLLDCPVAACFPASNMDDVQALLDRVLARGDPACVVDQAQQGPAGDTVYWTYTVWPLLADRGRVEGLVLQVSDTTAQVVARQHAQQVASDLQLANEQLLLTSLREQTLMETALQQALHDSLTGLPNRRLLLDRLEHVLQVAHREATPFALLLLDLDRFKTVNDSLGHLVGDQLLIQIAHRLTACLRSEDTVARLGGDEFAMLVMGLSEISAVVHIADRIQQSLAAPFHLTTHEVMTSASIGIVLGTPAYDRSEDLVRDADIALYRAKALGTARYALFDASMHASALALTQLEAELHQAITRAEFQLHYQPIVSLQTGTTIGVEALLRWQHPARGVLAPGAFLPVAEDSRLILAIGEWVLRTACTQTQAWHAAGLPPVYVAVNLSAYHLKQHDLGLRIAQIIQETGLAPQHVQLELTENSVMEDVTASIATLQQLTALGVQLALDDFGTGYSSLSYLRRLPLTTVKIDAAFVREIASDPQAAAIVSAIIAVAHRLGLQVIAEGVETDAQLACLQAEHCDAIQGHVVSRPLPGDVATQWLLERHTGTPGDGAPKFV